MIFVKMQKNFIGPYRIDIQGKKHKSLQDPQLPHFTQNPKMNC